MLFNAYTGVTTNQSKGLNNLLKQLNDRVELSFYIVVLSCYSLSIYYCNEIKYGLGNSGIYRL